jgi:Zn-dependent membrane protease YugP
MSNLGFYFLCLLIPFVFGIAVQGWLKSTFSRNNQIPSQSGLTGAEVARRILDSNGLQNVPVQPSKAGPLSDHYDPGTRAVFLSEAVFAGRSVAAAAVAAHEVGHAIQHARSYVPMTVRSAIWPAAALGSRAWSMLLVIGIIFSGAGALWSGLITVALILFAAVVVFQIVTLPVEFNASRRGLAQIRELRLVGDTQVVQARQTLTAAAMTYVAGALASIAQLIYFLALFRN